MYISCVMKHLLANLLKTSAATQPSADDGQQCSAAARGCVWDAEQGGVVVVGDLGLG